MLDGRHNTMMELDDLQCPICLELLSDPVLLPMCGHSHCRSCLISLTPQPPLCPICRTQHTGLSVDHLPTNYIVANLIRQQNTKDDTNNMTPKISTSPSLDFSSTSAGMILASVSPEVAEAPSAPTLSDILDIEEELVLSAVSLSQESQILNLNSETIETEQELMPTESTNVSNLHIPVLLTDEETSQSQSQREQSEFNDNATEETARSSGNISFVEMIETNNTNLYSSIIDMNTHQTAISPDGLCSNSRHLFSILRDASIPEPHPRSSIPIFHINQQPTVQIKNPEPRVFECKQIISGFILSLVSLLFMTAYSWMIVSSIFNTGFIIKFERNYTLIGGAFGLPRFIHLACRLIKGNSSKLEKCLYGLYFIFDLVMLLIGIIYFKRLGINTVIMVNSPFALIATISMIMSALSVTHFTALPKLKAKSECAKFLGCILLFIFTLSLFAGSATIIGVGYFYFMKFEQIYLLTSGVSGLLITLHGICFVLNGRRSCVEEYLVCLYFVFSLIWCIVGIILVETTAFWIVNGPMLAITGLFILFWSIRVTALYLNSSVLLNQSSSC